MKKDKSLRLAAAAVTLVIGIGLGGALLVKSALGLVVLVGVEAFLMIGIGIVLGRIGPEDEGT